ncbi:MAG: hypothetical protein AAF824_03170 [Bacteroidota bacterium]
MKKYTSCLLLNALLISMLFSTVEAQKKRDEEWKRTHKRENRFEGTYTRQVGNPAIELLSLTSSFEPYEFRKSQQLTVKFFSPVDTSYFLKAEELRIFKFYWMESSETVNQAITGWNEFGPWPVDDWLRRLSLTADKLGVLVRMGDWKSREILPVDIYFSEDPPVRNFLIAQFRLGRSISKGTFRLFKGKEKTSTSLLHKGKIGKKPGGSFFPVVMPKAWFQAEKGWYTLEVSLKEQGSFDDFSYSFSFYHSEE